MPADTISPCPKCSVPFDALSFEWCCAVCGHPDHSFSLVKGCDRCAFSPRLVPCPACREPLEIMRLMGSYHGSRNRLTIVPFAAIRDSGSFRYSLGSINSDTAHMVTQEEIDSIGHDALAAMWRTEFVSPFPIRQLRIISRETSDDSRHWLHLWLYRSHSRGRERDPTMQLAVVYPGRSGAGAEFVFTDVLVDEDGQAY